MSDSATIPGVSLEFVTYLGVTIRSYHPKSENGLCLHPRSGYVCAHSVAMHDSLKQAAVPGNAQEDVKSVRSGSMQSLLEVAASKVCRKWQHRSLSLEGQNLRSLSVGWQHIR